MISSCDNNHAFYGEICPICEEKATEYYSKVVGFITPISSYSKEREEEFWERKKFTLGD